MDKTLKNKTELGGTLYKLYRDAMKLEDIGIKDDPACESLTVNELHLLECISSYTNGGNGPAISTIACALDITRPSATVAVNKLANKKMVAKKGSEEDGRSVRVKLTAKGEKALAAHLEFQARLTSDLQKELSAEDCKTVASALALLDKFFDSKIDGLTGRTRKILDRETKSKGKKEKAAPRAKKAAANNAGKSKAAPAAKGRKPAKREKNA